MGEVADLARVYRSTPWLVGGGSVRSTAPCLPGWVTQGGWGVRKRRRGLSFWGWGEMEAGGQSSAGGRLTGGGASSTMHGRVGEKLIWGHTDDGSRGSGYGEDEDAGADCEDCLCS